jgi:ribosomal protein S18 acetylase RimI-like enzyme
MFVKRLGPGDEELLGAAVRAFRGVEDADPEASLADPAMVVLLALGDGGDVLGWAWGFRQRHLAGYSQVQLYQVDVAPGARRQGVGRALVGEFLAVVRAEGHSKMWLFTGEDNAPALALYESLGGGASGRTHETYWWTLR